MAVVGGRILERQEIEAKERRGELDGGALDVHWRRQATPLLEQGESGTALCIEHDDLAIDQTLIHGQRLDCPCDLWERRRIVIAVPRQEQCLAVHLGREKSIAIELELEQPSIPRECFLRRLGKHDLHPSWIDPRRGRTGVGDGAAHLCTRLVPALTSSTVSPENTDPSGNWSPGSFTQLSRSLMSSQSFSLFFIFTSVHFPCSLYPFSSKSSLPFFEALSRVFEGQPFPAVPDDHTARAVVAGGNDPFEVSVLEGVVLHLHGEPLVVHVVRGSLGHCPRSEHPVHLQPEIEVELTRRMFVNHEEPAGNRGHGADRLGRPVGRSLCAIGGQTVRRCGRDRAVRRITSCGHALLV